jgi:zinc D-Ala-D-Ala carboxypeptidase
MTLVLSSGYRSYSDQAALYASGSVASEAVAPPGYSEHQSGLAADVIPYNYFCAAQGCFALSRAAAWLDQNSYRYGFIVRYPLYKEASTGYEYEPWHLRYVGIPLAERLHTSGQTLEEFYGLP